MLFHLCNRNVLYLLEPRNVVCPPTTHHYLSVRRCRRILSSTFRLNIVQRYHDYAYACTQS